MTKITGIIAEFNPFHKGHQYLLEQADGVKIVAMSGNWMQRGEPAFIDKWTRAEMALQNGADLVVELPVLVAVQGADYFAAGAVEILRTLGVDELLFGTENDEKTDYQRISEIYAAKSMEMAAYLAALPELMSYPAKAERMWSHFAEVKFDGGTPNHILGLAYAKAASETNIRLRTVQRETNYNDTVLSGSLASATAIRHNWTKAQDVVPENCWDLLQNAPKTSWADFWELLRYKIISTLDLTQIYQVNIELASRIKASIKQAQNLEELIELVYTKRYTKGHIRRILVYILLNIRRDFTLPEQVHVLGFTSAGQKVLANARGKLCTRIGKFPWDLQTQRADDIYRLGNQKMKEQAFGRKPLRS